MSTAGQNLDTRLLRYRARRGIEGAAQLAADLVHAGRAADALEVTTAALAVSPDDPDLLLADGRARLASNDLLGAQASLLKAAKIDPSRKDPFRWLGEVLMKRGDPHRAVKVLERALDLDPGDRVIAALRQRAERLAGIADSAGDDSAGGLAEADERTAVRTDLTEQLRSFTAGFDAQDDDEPTNVVGGAAVQQALRGVPAPSSAAKRQAAPPRPSPGTEARGGAKPSPFGGMPPKRGAPPFGKAAAPFPPAKAPLPPAKPLAPAAPPLPARKAAPPFAPTKPAGEGLEAAGKAAPPFAKRAASVEVEPDFDPPTHPAERAISESTAVPGSGGDSPPRESLSSSTPSRAPAFESAQVDVHEAHDDGPAWLQEASGPVEPAPHVPVGGGGPEDVDAILQMLRDQGLFEPPSGEPASWLKRGEAKKMGVAGTRIGVWLGALWVLAIGAAAGGWFGWQWYVEQRHAEAARLVEQARVEGYRGSHADLVDAERHLREARDLNPRDVAGPALLLFVHAQRALEDGAFEAGYLRPTIARGERLEADPAYLDIARAVLAAAEGGHEDARRRLAAALEARPDDAAILYLAGRLEQRLGGEGATAHLEAAVEREPALVAPRIALAEVRYDEGRAEEALALLDQVLANDADHLRAKLWRAFMTSDADEPAAALAALDALQETVAQHGAPTDHVVRQLARARLLRRQGNAEAAGEAVDAALLAGASEPRLLALVAMEGRRAGRLLRAEQAARTAVSGAPQNPDFRKLLAEIEIARRNGRGALATLAELDAADPDVVLMRAEAALLLGTEDALRASADALDALVTANADASVQVRAIRIRTHARLGDLRDGVAQARALVREAPGDPSAALALGEAALAAREARVAVEALRQAVQASPDDAEAHYLLGRARRMSGDGEGAEQSFRRALELTPEHLEARLALGGLLLDMGNYAAADDLYAELARSARSVSGQAATVAGRLGRVEALTGLGRFDDAAVQLESLQPDVRETPSARIAAARLLLARGRAGDALGQLRPLANAEGASPSLLALYGDALLAAAQTEPAAEAYAAALAQDGGLPEALLGQAEIAVRAGRGDDALPLLERVARALETRIRPPAMQARMHLLRGRALLAGGRAGAAAAVEALRAAVAIEGAPAEAHFFLAEALSAMDSPDAQASYQRYLELAPEGEHAARARRAVRR